MKETAFATIPIAAALMRINTRQEKIDMQQIQNRRFMYDPISGTLILGKQWREGLHSTHADELAEAGITTDYDRFVRGWIGTSKSYPQGVIHFAPCVDSRNISLFERAFQTLEMFRENGASGQTVIRGFGNQWEQPMTAILPEQKIPEKSKTHLGHKASPKRKEPTR